MPRLLACHEIRHQCAVPRLPRTSARRPARPRELRRFFATARLHLRCSAPWYRDGSPSTWPRSNGSPGSIGRPHRAHKTPPSATFRAQPFRNALCLAPASKAWGQWFEPRTAHFSRLRRMTKAEELGRGGRLRGGAAGELVAAAYAAESAHGPRLAHGLSLADLAHAVALVEGGDLAGDDARALLRGLLELHAIPGDEFPWDPSLGDAFNAREAELERRVGRSAAGWLSAGRPRREAFRVGAPPDRPQRPCASCTTRSSTRPRRSPDTRAPRAPRSPPTTRICSRPSRRPSATCSWRTPIPALRDAERARASHAALGASVAGAGGSAGSRWALDRARLAELLGCDGLVEHAKDAAWQADVYVELLATLAIAATHQSQLGQDFEIYASQEFGLVELADAHSRASALMPQKKNPYALAAIRTQAGQAAGDLAARARDPAHRLGAHRSLPPPERHGAAGARRGGRDRPADGVGAGRHRAARRRASSRSRARASSRRPTSPTCSRSPAGSTTAAPTRSSAAPCATSSRRASRRRRSRRRVCPRPPRPRSATPVELDEATLRDALDPAACAAARRQIGSSSAAAMDAMLDGLDATLAARRVVERGRARARGGRGGGAARPRPRARLIRGSPVRARCHPFEPSGRL